jgi:Transposase domain (DUF772)
VSLVGRSQEDASRSAVRLKLQGDKRLHLTRPSRVFCPRGAALLRLYICGYLNRVHSSRPLERDAGRNVEAMWLLAWLAPDHKTIADFRKDNGPASR